MTAIRITFDPNIMGGKACLRGTRVTVSVILGLFAAGKSAKEILALYPYLTDDDLTAALEHAAERVGEPD